jgi:acyl-CoA synthetase (AMP-forming)/AMP-acid ligase II
VIRRCDQADGPRPPGTPSDAITASASGYKYAREVRLVDQVPLAPVGKVDRKRLRAMLAG